MKLAPRAPNGWHGPCGVRRSAIVLTKIAKEKALPFEMRVPNALTAETLAKSDRGEDVYHAKDANDLFGQLGI